MQNSNTYFGSDLRCQSSHTTVSDDSFGLTGSKKCVLSATDAMFDSIRRQLLWLRPYQPAPMHPRSALISVPFRVSIAHQHWQNCCVTNTVPSFKKMTWASCQKLAFSRRCISSVMQGNISSDNVPTKEQASLPSAFGGTRRQPFYY